MTTIYRLTVDGLIKLARLERPDIADWIEARLQENAAAITNALAQPIDTAAGQLIPGHRYNVTVSTQVYGQRPRGIGEPGERELFRTDSRVLKNVTPRRGPYGAMLVYPSGRTAAHIYDTGNGVPTAIEELS